MRHHAPGTLTLRTVVGIAVLLAGGCAVGHELQPAALPPDPGPTASTVTLTAPSDPSAIRISGASFAGWALLDRRTAEVTGSPNSTTGRSSVESMIKAWIASDYLRRLAASEQRPTQRALSELNLMIVDSNDRLAEKYFQLGGGDAVTRRMVSICKLSNVRIAPYQWALTELSAQDAARYGACLADGRAAGPMWTQWILDSMSQVRGDVKDQRSTAVQGGRWGIIDGLPSELAADAVMKNGWTYRGDRWHIACLAVHEDWVLAVMMRRPGTLQGAANECAKVAEQLVTTPRE